MSLLPTCGDVGRYLEALDVWVRMMLSSYLNTVRVYVEPSLPTIPSLHGEAYQHMDRLDGAAAICATH